MQTQITTKNNRKWKRYKITLLGFNKILEDLDVHVRNQGNESPTPSTIHNYNKNTNGLDNKFKGIKTKVKARGKFSRLKSALEMAKKRKKNCQWKFSFTTGVM